MIVKHRLGQYEVLLGDVQESLQRESDALIITDENVFAAWGHLLKGRRIHRIRAGETSKSLDVYEECLHWLAGHKTLRDQTLIAFGGGVVGDLAGFVGATYMRGIRLVQVPTTLLAMVDSSVGGKVGIDLPEGKNLVGSFYPPSAVIIDLQTLSTLPEREFNNGSAEIWKYGAIMDWPLFENLETKPLGPGDSRLPEMVMHCVGLKKQVVEADEYEASGQRAILNFGHTVGHAIERSTGYGPILHGEAISLGMIVESAIGVRLRLTPPDVPGRLVAGLQRQGLPTRLPGTDSATLVESMRLDKKAAQGRLAFALLTGYGSCKLVQDVPEPVVLECLREHL